MTPATSAMIIDDSEIDRWMLKYQLEQAGAVKVFEQIDGDDALAFLSHYAANKTTYGDCFPPTLIFLDVNMPIMDGPEFVERFADMRTKLDFSQCTIIVYSASDEAEELDQMMQFDFVDHYLIKGKVTIDILRDTLTRFS